MTSIVRSLALAVAGVDLTLVAYILYRRASHNRYYRLKDAAERRYAAAVQESLTGIIPIPEAAQRLKSYGRAEREAIRTQVLSAIAGATQERATALLQELGFVAEWAEAAFGRQRAQQLLGSLTHGSVLPTSRPVSRRSRLQRLRGLSIMRAEAVGHLGRLSPEFAACFCREALHDPSPIVRQVAIAGMGRNPTVGRVPILLDELSKVVRGESDLPVRSVKTALVRYPIQELQYFLPFMNSENARFRFLAVDSIREICKRTTPDRVAKDFPIELRRWFLQKAIRDESPDVRARSAVVISYFRDESAAQALRVLLRDENEFVRLHSVRACADPKYVQLIPDILERITDRKWRVREAAVRTVAVLPADGAQLLETLFLKTTDRYACEQIADELQRSGMIRQTISALALPDTEEARRAREICSNVANLGMTSLMTETLVRGEEPASLRSMLLEVLRFCETPQFLAALRTIAASVDDPLRRQAEDIWASKQAARAAASCG